MDFFEFLTTEFAVFSKPPSRDNLRKWSYPGTLTRVGVESKPCNWIVIKTTPLPFWPPHRQNYDSLSLQSPFCGYGRPACAACTCYLTTDIFHCSLPFDEESFKLLPTELQRGKLIKVSSNGMKHPNTKCFTGEEPRCCLVFSWTFSEVQSKKRYNQLYVNKSIKLNFTRCFGKLISAFSKLVLADFSFSNRKVKLSFK